MEKISYKLVIQSINLCGDQPNGYQGIMLRIEEGKKEQTLLEQQDGKHFNSI